MGTILKKSFDEAFAIIKDMASNCYQRDIYIYIRLRARASLKYKKLDAITKIVRYSNAGTVLVYDCKSPSSF